MSKKKKSKSSSPLKRYTKDELIMAARGSSIVTNIKVQMLLTIGVLWDVFDFTEEDVNLFVDKYKELLDSYNKGNENMKQWAENIKELTGVEIEV